MAFFSIQNGLLVKANQLKRKAIFLIGEQFISGLSEHEVRKLEQSSSARSANARATPGWPAGINNNLRRYLLKCETLSCERAWVSKPIRPLYEDIKRFTHVSNLCPCMLFHRTLSLFRTNFSRRHDLRCLVTSPLACPIQSSAQLSVHPRSGL